MHIIRSRPKKRDEKTRELSDKEIAKSFQNWSDKNLDKRNGLNIIDKPVSKNGFARWANRLQIRERPVRDTKK